MRIHQYYVYIITNSRKTVYYIGVTNNIEQRLADHYFNRGDRKTFAGRYYCFYLVYYEIFKYVDKAILRETELKTWKRSRKDLLILDKNLTLGFLNNKFMDWPPGELWRRKQKEEQ